MDPSLPMNIVRVNPFDVLEPERLIAPGSMLILNINSLEFLALYSTQNTYHVSQNHSCSQTQCPSCLDGVVCRMQVPIDLIPRDGFLSVAIRVKRGVTKRVEVLYVNPKDICIAESQKHLDEVHQYVYPKQELTET
jgi:hypothetical protein